MALVLCFRHLRMEGKVIDKSILLGWILLAEKLGVHTSSMVAELDIQDDDSHVPFSKFVLFANWALEKSGNKNIGLLLGEQSNIAALGIVGQVVKSSSTIEQGLEQAVRFFNLISNVLSLRLETKENSVSLIFDIDSNVYEKCEKVSQQLLLTSMLFASKEIYFLTLQTHQPLAMSLAFKYPESAEIESYFKCKLANDTNQTALHFDKHLLNLPIVYSDYELMLTLEKLACQRLMNQNEHLKVFSDVVRSVIQALINPYLPDLQTVAKHLNMSERSLQRKLKSENTSFTQLIIDIKKDLAGGLLEKGISIKETSYILGYSEPSAFIKAFQKWYEKTPNSYKLAKSLTIN